jgi:4-hydroxy-tetrahydrodipicolinate reductase
MGRVACGAFTNSAGVIYAGGFARTRVPAERIFDDLNELFAVEKPDVLLDLTTYPDSVSISMEALAHGIRPVIGATGWSDQERETLAKMAQERNLGAMMVPNFSLGAVLMMKFAAEAAKYFPSVEIVELHHDQKKDAPSGTSMLTAQRIAASGGPANAPIHSVRMRGLQAHQEVLFGGEGEMLTIRHDAFSRESYVAGMLAAVTRVMEITGLQVGLDA